MIGLIVSGAAQATPINLNDFFADPTATVAGDGSSAILAEDSFLSSVLLANDPGLGDPNVIIPNAGVSLTFDYEFVEGVAIGENDEFGVFVVDGTTGFSVGASFEFFTQDTSSGSISFDLSSLVGQTLGLQFQLSALPGDSGLDSIVTLSNVQLTTDTSNVVPEPQTYLLLGIGMIGLVAIRLKNKLRLKIKEC